MYEACAYNATLPKRQAPRLSPQFSRLQYRPYEGKPTLPVLCHGYSCLSYLPFFDVVRGVVIGTVHKLTFGVAENFYRLLFPSESERANLNKDPNYIIPAYVVPVDMYATISARSNLVWTPSCGARSYDDVAVYMRRYKMEDWTLFVKTVAPFVMRDVWKDKAMGAVLMYMIDLLQAVFMHYLDTNACYTQESCDYAHRCLYSFAVMAEIHFPCTILTQNLHTCLHLPLQEAWTGSVGKMLEWWVEQMCQAVTAAARKRGERLSHEFMCNVALRKAKTSWWTNRIGHEEFFQTLERLSNPISDGFITLDDIDYTDGAQKKYIFDTNDSDCFFIGRGIRVDHKDVHRKEDFSLLRDYLENNDTSSLDLLEVDFDNDMEFMWYEFTRAQMKCNLQVKSELYARTKVSMRRDYVVGLSIGAEECVAQANRFWLVRVRAAYADSHTDHIYRLCDLDVYEQLTAVQTSKYVYERPNLPNTVKLPAGKSLTKIQQVNILANTERLRTAYKLVKLEQLECLRVAMKLEGTHFILSTPYQHT